MLRWFFSVRSRHHAGIRRYEKGGAGVRIFTLALVVVLAGAVLGVEYWGFSLLQDNFLVGLLALIFLSLPLLVGTVELGGVYAVTAIKMFIYGCAERASQREAQAQGDMLQPQRDEAKTHRALDMVVFVCCLVVAIGIVVAYVVCLTLWM